jgi:uncharacterized protein involved in exopolysaccharide biosynthesis
MAIDASLSEMKEHAHSSASPRANGAAHNEDEISVLDLLIIIAERKRVVFWITASFAILSIAISLILPKRYIATVVLLPPQQNSSMSSAIASQLGNLGGMAALAGGSLGLKNPNEMYIAMLKSRTVEDAMVQHFGLMREYDLRYLSDTRKEFEKHATVDGNSKDGLIHISVEDRDPNRAAELANGYVDQYRNLSEHLAITEASQRRLFFEQQLEQAKDNLASAEEGLKETQQKTGLIQIDSQARALIESAATLRAQIAAKEVQMQSMRTFATNENSELVQAQQELEGLRAQLAKLGGSEESADASLMIPKGKVPEAGLEYFRRLRDVKYNETIFDILARQFELAKLDEAKEGALIQVVDPAVPPDRRSFPKRGLMVTVATVGGFFVGILFVLLNAGFQYIMKDSESASKVRHFRNALHLQRDHLSANSPNP